MAFVIVNDFFCYCMVGKEFWSALSYSYPFLLGSLTIHWLKIYNLFPLLNLNEITAKLCHICRLYLPKKKKKNKSDQTLEKDKSLTPSPLESNMTYLDIGNLYKGSNACECQKAKLIYINRMIITCIKRRTSNASFIVTEKSSYFDFASFILWPSLTWCSVDSL